MKTEIKPYSILVVEDNAGDFFLLEQYLRMSTVPVGKIMQAETMEAARALIKEQQFDIALLDLTLPDSTGLDSVNSLISLLPKTPIIVLSGVSTMKTATNSIALGIQDYLVKGEYDEKLLAKSIQYSIERKKTLGKLEESILRYELVNKATNDTIWEWNLQTNDITRNFVFANMYGYSHNEIQYNRDWMLQNIHPSDRERIQSSIKDCIHHQQDTWQAEYRFLASDGTYRDVYDRAYVVFDAAGNASQMIGAMSDMTEKKKLEAEILSQQVQQQRRLVEVNILAHEEEKNELGRELHDNINQMLATIKMYLGMAKAGHGKSSDDLIGKSYNYLNDTMNELRKLSHSLVAPSLGDIGLVEALQDLVNEANFTKTVDMKLTVDENFSDHDIDKHKELMIYRIVQEQLNNIYKYAKAKEVIITIRKQADNLSLSVSDDGVGFDVLKRSKGIGLNNINNRVAYYEGSMNLITSPGNGCILNVEIPLTN